MSQVFKSIGRFLGLLFGNVSWSRPPWMGQLAGGIGKHRRVIGLFIGVVVLVVGVYSAYQMLPKPVRFDAGITAPQLTPQGEELHPQPLYITFKPVFDTAEQRDEFYKQPRSIARLELVNEELAGGVQMQPDMPGVWRWSDEQTLSFQPKQDWPASQEYAVTFESSIFTPEALLTKSSYSFKTPGFNISLTQYEFYQSPKEKNQRKVVATLTATHPVDVESLKEKLKLSMRPSDQKISVSPVQYGFTVEHDKHQRSIYIHSDPIQIPEHENYMKLVLQKGVRAAQGSAGLEKEIEKTVLIPSMASYFKVKSTQALIVNNDQGEPEQALVVQFSDEINSQDVVKRSAVYLLPDKDAKGRHKYWRSPREIDADALQRAEKLAVRAVATERDTAMVHSFIFDVPENRQIYLKIEKGLRSENDFLMSTMYDSILIAPVYPKQVQIMSEGALLSLSGEHKLPFQSRGVAALQVEIGRVLPGQINHLVSQTSGDISRPRFNNYNFSADNITEKSKHIIALAESHPKKAVYSSFDLDAEYLQEQKPGLFFIEVNGWDTKNKRIIHGVSDKRLVLVTDLGLLVKANADQSHDIFVQSVATGEPVAGALISLLGKNGQSVLDATSDARGHAGMPPSDTLQNEKEPVVFVVRTANDTAFIPYKNNNRIINYSRFDIDGLNTRHLGKDSLDAFLFSDRGIYRPGDMVNIATIVKRHDFVPVTDIPLEVSITDPQGRQVYEKRMPLAAGGFFDFQYQTERVSATGGYTAQVFLVKNNYRSQQLGSVQFKVEEFQPDRMKIHSRFSEYKSRGWVSLAKFDANVTLENLFGTPAQDRRVTAVMNLTPTEFYFNDYQGFTFVDPFYDPKKNRSDIRETFPAQQTDAEGRTAFPIDLDRYEAGTYRMGFTAEGFEAGDGRSVSTSSSMLVSPLTELIGYKPDGDLNYIYRNATRSVRVINIDSDLRQTGREGLYLHLIENQYISTLVQQANGTYQYQSVRKRKPVAKNAFGISKQGTDYALVTEEPGDYIVEITDEQGRVLSRFDYTVVGTGNLAGKLEKSAELKITLNKTDYKPGESIELSIVAPYTGAGLITIESNKVHAFKWFVADTNSSVQSIDVPDDLEGSAYVNVAFVRSLNSKEIFTSPLSYAVMPFSIDRSQREIDITLTVPEKIRPGDDLTIRYAASKTSRIAIFAVDEGILQVARYQTPQPLNHFLKKRALEVGTAQIVDLILPEFYLVKERAAAGGGMDDRSVAESLSRNLNPFMRSVDKPVAFWSGILEAGPDTREQTFAIPDSFDGSLRVMAVAVNDAAIGTAESKTLVRGPFVLSPNLLTATAPGDEFEVVLGVANGLEGSGKQLAIEVEALPSVHLQLVGDSKHTIQIDEGAEGKVSFRVKALQKPGAASITFRAAKGDEISRRTATLSVRPAAPYISSFDSGYNKSGKDSLQVERTLYPDLVQNRLTVSASPLALVDGLASYLTHFPHMCTEQIVSRTFPLLSYLQHPDYLGDPAAKHSQLEALLQTLRGRQTADGGFSIWPGASDVGNYPSAYVMHFLLDAGEQGLPVPSDMLSRGFDHLRSYAAKEALTLSSARNRAYAIYLLTRNGEVTTNFLVNLQEYLEKEHKDTWKKDIIAVFVASTYQLMRESQQAESLIKNYVMGLSKANDWSDYDSLLAHDGQYIYLLARHFPEHMARVDGEQILTLVQPVFEGRYNTLSSAWSVLALDAYSKQVLPQDRSEQINMLQKDKTKTEKQLKVISDPYPHAEFFIDAQTVAFAGQERLFYLLRQSGFDIEPPQDELREGLEIIREYQDADGKNLSEFQQGKEVTVVLRVRTLQNRHISNIAVIDLLPGGFEVLRDSVSRQYSYWSADYLDVREDRVVHYGSFGPEMTELRYKAKLISQGDFIVPSAYAEAMYDRSIRARSKPARFVVTAAE